MRVKVMCSTCAGEGWLTITPATISLLRLNGVQSILCGLAKRYSPPGEQLSSGSRSRG